MEESRIRHRRQTAGAEKEDESTKKDSKKKSPSEKKEENGSKRSPKADVPQSKEGESDFKEVSQFQGTNPKKSEKPEDKFQKKPAKESKIDEEKSKSKKGSEAPRESKGEEKGKEYKVEEKSKKVSKQGEVSKQSNLSRSEKKIKNKTKEDLDHESHIKRLNHDPPKPEQIYAERPEKRSFWQYCIPVGYLLVLWTFLFAMTFPIIYSLPTLYIRGPENVGPGSFLGSIPKLSFEPNVARLGKIKGGSNEMEQRQKSPSLISYTLKHPKTYEPYLTQLRFLLLNQYGIENFPQCGDNYKAKGDGKDVCLVKLTDTSPELGYGDCAVQGELAKVISTSFHFGETNPCIMIRQNRMMHFVPPYTDISEIDPNMTETINDRCRKEFPHQKECCLHKRVLLECDSNQTKIFPSYGVPSCHYPYKVSSDKAEVNEYQQPFYFVQLNGNNLENREHMVTCWLKGMKDIKKHKVTYKIHIKNEFGSGNNNLPALGLISMIMITLFRMIL